MLLWFTCCQCKITVDTLGTIFTVDCCVEEQQLLEHVAVRRCKGTQRKHLTVEQLVFAPPRSTAHSHEQDTKCLCLCVLKVAYVCVSFETCLIPPFLLQSLMQKMFKQSTNKTVLYVW